jgi:hypothetical protein
MADTSALIPACVLLISENGAMLDPLIAAIFLGDFDRASELLDAGADPNAADDGAGASAGYLEGLGVRDPVVGIR